MRFEFAGICRRTVLRKVCWARADERSTCGDLAGDEAGVIKLANSNSEIDSSLHQIHYPRTHRKANLYVRITVQKFCQYRCNKSDRKVCFGCYVQAARRVVREPTDGQSRHVEIRDDPMSMLKIDLARLGETLLARRPVKEPRTELAL